MNSDKEQDLERMEEEERERRRQAQVQMDHLIQTYLYPGTAFPDSSPCDSGGSFDSGSCGGGE